MPKCAMRNCKNITSRTLKKDGISYFRFPRDPIRCGEWTLIVSQQREEEFFKPNDSSVVCSEHFLDEDIYITSKGIKRILKTAIPRVIKTPHDGDNNEDRSLSSMFDLESKKELKLPSSSLSMGSIMGTPRKVSIKRELQKCRKMLIKKEKVINNLREVISRLIKKNILLKNNLEVLKKRLNLD